MKTAFHQQISEYDCVPTTFLNALKYLFDRGDIPPLVIQRIYLYCLDSMWSNNAIGHGTSDHAVKLLGSWLSEYRHKNFRVASEYCETSSIHFRQGNKISACLNRKGVALLSVKHGPGEWHYVLGLSVADGWLYCYDPYRMKIRMPKGKTNYEFIEETDLHSPNLRIRCSFLDTKSEKKRFQLGPMSQRECLLLWRE